VNLSLRARLLLLLGIVLTGSLLPLAIYSHRLTASLLASWDNPKIERALGIAVTNTHDPQDEETARAAYRAYGQLKALRKPIQQEMFWVTGFIALALAASALLLSTLFVSRMTRPLDLLTRAAGKISEGDLDARVEARSTPEIDSLIQAFNKMAGDLKTSREDLGRAERRAAWREVAQRIAHEIKNPLTPIRLSTERLRDKLRKGSPDLNQALDSGTQTILTEISSLERMVTEFSKFARLPAPINRPIAPRELFQEISELYASPPPGVLLFVDCAQGLSRVLGDVAQLKEVLVNLVDNAVHVLKEKGGKVTLGAKGEEGQVILSVSDNGPGISTEDLPHLFEPYFTKRPGGTGLGLAIVERIVSEHGGKITVESRLGQGTTFTIRLPALKA